MLLRAYRDGTDPRTADGWLPTGDVGELTADGLGVRVGRGDMIVSGGENVWPEAVEAVLAAPRGAEVAVAGRADDEWGQRVVACVVPADPAWPPTLALRRDHTRSCRPRPPTGAGPGRRAAAHLPREAAPGLR